MRKIASTLIAGAFVFALAACSSGKEPEGPVLYFSAFPDMALANSAQSFPKIKLTQQTPPEGLDVVLTSQLGHSGLSVPDFLPTEWNQAYLETWKKGNLFDLRTQWPADPANAQLWKGFAPLVKEGAAGFLPASASWYALYFRPSTLTKLGLKAPLYLDDLEAFAAAAKQKGLVPFALGAATGWPALLWFSYLDLRLNGPDLHLALLKGERKFTDPTVVAVLQRLQAWRDKGWFTSDAAEKTWEGSLTALQQEQAGLVLMGAFIKDRWPADLDLAFSPFPSDPKRNGSRGELAAITGFVFPARAGNFFGAFALASEYRKQGSPGLTLNTFALPIGTPAAPSTDYKKAGADLLASADIFLPPFERFTDPVFGRSVQRLLSAFFTPGVLKEAKDLAEKLEFIRTN